MEAKQKTVATELNNCIYRTTASENCRSQKKISDIGSRNLIIDKQTTLFVIHGFILDGNDNYTDIEFQIWNNNMNYKLLSIPMSFLIDMNEKIMRRNNEYFINCGDHVDLTGFRQILQCDHRYKFVLTKPCKCRMVYTTGYKDTIPNYALPNIIRKMKSNVDITMNLGIGINSLYIKNTNCSIEKIVIEYRDYKTDQLYRSTYDMNYLMYCMTPLICANIPKINSKMLKLGFSENSKSHVELLCNKIKITMFDKDNNEINDDIYFSIPQDLFLYGGAINYNSNDNKWIAGQHHVYSLS